MVDMIEIEDIKRVALKAGKEIMNIYSRDFQIEYKDDKSPLSEADIKSNEIIYEELGKLYPDIPIISEESREVAFETRKSWEYYWCVDPIDGTKEFIKKNGEFTVNIALIHKDTPLLGVVYAPAINKLYYAKKGFGAYLVVLDDNYGVLSRDRLPLLSSHNLSKKLTVVASKSHMSDETEKFIDSLALSTQELSLTSKGSSLKLCMVAAGEADIYPRLAPTMEWDTAAAHAIALEAGKKVYIYDETLQAKEYLQTTARLQPIVYNKENLLNPYFVVA